jgi:hypothetical protein
MTQSICTVPLIRINSEGDNLLCPSCSRTYWSSCCYVHSHFCLRVHLHLSAFTNTCPHTYLVYENQAPITNSSKSRIKSKYKYFCPMLWVCYWCDKECYILWIVLFASLLHNFPPSVLLHVLTLVLFSCRMTVTTRAKSRRVQMEINADLQAELAEVVAVQAQAADKPRTKTLLTSDMDAGVPMAHGRMSPSHLV